MVDLILGGDTGSCAKKYNWMKMPDLSRSYTFIHFSILFPCSQGKVSAPYTKTCLYVKKFGWVTLKLDAKC